MICDYLLRIQFALPFLGGGGGNVLFTSCHFLSECSLRLIPTDEKSVASFELWILLCLLHVDGTREAAFTTATLSAALAYSVAKACTAKDVTECSCEGVKRPLRGQQWKWKGCSVNVRFGSHTAERFMLSGRGNNSQTNMMARHNVRVGLEVKL